MHEILKSLHEDHVNLMKLLTLVRREFREPTHDGDVDYNLILDVLDYIENYADAVHHACENQVYARLAQAYPDHAALVERLFSEHQQLQESTLSASSFLSNALNDVILDKRTVDESVEDYVAAQSEHMSAEEREIFPLVDSVFDPSDWKYVAGQIQTADDPLFGERIKDRYRSLYESLSSMH